jgi:putative aldouronate transport system substrate-binding protein
MKKMKKTGLICIFLALTIVLAACAIPGTGGTTTPPAQTGTDGNTPAPQKAEPKKISILAITFTGTPIAEDEPAVLALEELTGYDITLEFLLNSSYEDQLNARMAAQNLPALVAITGKTASVISNCRAGAFWDITDHYKNYPNLAKANPIVMNNISIDGRIYGIYRARPLGRNAISYRKDWLENVGLSEPKTMDELYNVLKAFTYNDPDRNGQDDTYGMTWCKYFGPLDQIAVAFGAPNKWGEGADGKLIPYFDTPEFMESMKYIRKLYEEGLINKDYAAMETSDWTKDFQNSKSGVHIDVSDQAWRFQKKFIDEQQMPGDIVWVMGMPEGPKGKRVLPTSGHAGFVAISKNGAPKESDMKDALNFLDLCNTKECQNILNWGVEGIHYDLNEKGEATRRSFTQDPMEGFNQFMTNVVDGLLIQEALQPVQKRHLEVQAENIQYCIGNPAEPLTSDTYAKVGSQLDQMINDARNQFVAGQLDEAGFKAVVANWYAQGGQAICDEYTAAYKAAKN